MVRESSAALPDNQEPCFDLILANHVFYYVAEHEASVAMLRNALSSTGPFIAAISGRDNALFRFWERGFALLQQPVPYYVGEDFVRQDRIDMSTQSTHFIIEPPQ